MNSEKAGHLALATSGDSAAGAGASEPTSSFAQAKATVTTTARETTARIKSAASETASRAKETAQRIASDTKESAADRIGGYSSAMRKSAKTFESQDPNIAWATNQAADRLQQVADYVRNRDFDELKADAETIARRHPVAFFGGLLVAGLVVGNLIKARRPGPQREELTDEFDFDHGDATGNDPATESPAPSGF